MKIAVMGAGAVGCYYGALLARAGCDVTLIGREGHVEAIRRHGLRLETAAFAERISLAADTRTASFRGAQIVLFCVKAIDTESAATRMAPYLDAGTLVVSLQNGVDNAVRLRARLTQEVVAAAVYVAVEMAAPGHVRHHGRGELVIGHSSADDLLIGMFAGAGIPVRVSPRITDELWAKLIVNCAYNALSAISRLPYGLLVAVPGVREVIDAVLSECLAVAAADGIDVPGDIRETVRSISRTMPDQLSSTAQDLARHRPSEIDRLNGYVVERGDALGIATPTNRFLQTMVRLCQVGGAQRP